MSKYSKLDKSSASHAEDFVPSVSPPSSSSSSFATSIELATTRSAVPSDPIASYYLSPNGNLINDSITPLPPHSPTWEYTQPIDPRVAAQPDFEVCSIGNKPNPLTTYTKEVSGIDSKPHASFWKWLVFGWVSPLISVGFHRDINLDDLPLLPQEYMAQSYTPRISKAWHANRHRTRLRFAATIWDTFSPFLKRMWVLKIFIICLQLSRPLILSTLLRGITHGYDRTYLFGLVVTLTCISMIQALCVHHFWWNGVAVAMASRGACIGLIYDKSLKMHSCERTNYTSGRISNLANVDCDNIRDFMWGAIHEIWASPLVILLTSVALFLLLGVSSLLGVALLVSSLYLTSRLCQYMSDLQDVIMHYGDERVSLMSELVMAIKTVKLYAWEDLFIRQVKQVREEQMKSIWIQLIVSSANRVLGLSVPLLVSFLTFTCFILTDGYGSMMSHTLDASTAFTSLLLFNMLKEPLGKLPECLNNFIRLKISMERVIAFLLTKEKEQYVDQMDDSDESVPHVTYDVEVNGASFEWGQRVVPVDVSVENSTNDKAVSNSSNGHGHSSSTSKIPLNPFAISDEPEPDYASEEEEEEGEDEIELDETYENEDPDMEDVSANPLSLADEIRREQVRAEKQHRIDQLKQKTTAAVKQTKKKKKQQQQSLSLSASTSSDSLSSLSSHHSHPIALPNLNLRVPAGELWMVVGEVGSSKSSLLAALLGEMACVDDVERQAPSPSTRRDSIDGAFQPAVTRRRRIAYTSQIAWLESETIRANILFGLPYDEARYRRAIHVCALGPDLRRFPQGDRTIVGENGLTLSGGQKARLVLARAIYSNADLYLFDEPLAAVDAHVSRWLFDHAIGPNSILQNKTRILITHQLQFCSPLIDCIVVLKKGRVIAQGTYAQVQAQGVDLHSILEQTHSLQAGEEVDEKHDQDHVPAMETDSSAAIADTASPPNPSASPLSPELKNPLQSSPSPTAAQELTVEELSQGSGGAQAIQYKDEDLQQGRMSMEVYREYFKAGSSVWGYLIVALIIICSQAASLSSDYFLATWSTSITRAVAAAAAASAAAAGNATQPQAHENTHVIMAVGLDNPWQSHALYSSSTQFDAAPSTSAVDYLPHTQSYYIAIYGTLVLTSGILLLVRSVFIARTSCASARVLHDRLFAGVIRAPQYFFESTPSGRILNRFAKDQEQCDMLLPGCVQDISECGVIVLGTIGLIVFISPFSIFPLLLIGLLYHRVQLYYHPTSRQLKRLESITRSPIYQLLAETATGITTIRAYEYTGSMSRCMRSCYERVDVNTRMMYYSFSVHRWLGIRLEAIGAMIVLVASSLALAMSDSLGVGLVGLSISTTLGLAGNLNWTVRQVSEMENQLNSVERILEYAKVEPEEKLNDIDQQALMNTSSPTEAAAKKTKQRKTPSKRVYTSVPSNGHADAADDDDAELEIASSSSSSSFSSSAAAASAGVLANVPANWPTHGAIEFRDLSLAYRPDPAFPLVLSSVNANIKGGEKIGIVGRTGAGKSTLSLALFRLITTRKGSIWIDGIDISTLPLHFLRSRLAMIPQDPVLYHSSLRANLDPFETVTDTRLWEIIEMVGLKEMVSNLPGGLDFFVQDGGQNFSLGERQLFVMARAVVRQSKILVMDEATSSLDFHTDQLLKTFVARHFAHCTVITIAHRLNTILDAQRIMVFDAGKLVEFDEPKKLLADPNGYLTWLVHETNSAGLIHKTTK